MACPGPWPQRPQRALRAPKEGSARVMRQPAPHPAMPRRAAPPQPFHVAPYQCGGAVHRQRVLSVTNDARRARCHLSRGGVAGRGGLKAAAAGPRGLGSGVVPSGPQSTFRDARPGTPRRRRSEAGVQHVDPPGDAPGQCDVSACLHYPALVVVLPWHSVVTE